MQRKPAFVMDIRPGFPPGDLQPPQCRVAPQGTDDVKVSGLAMAARRNHKLRAIPAGLAPPAGPQAAPKPPV